MCVHVAVCVVSEIKTSVFFNDFFACLSTPFFFWVSQLHIKGAKNSDANDAGENKRGEFFPYVFFLLPSTLLKYKTMQPILFLTNVHSKFHFVSMWLYLPLLDLTERESGGSTA